MLQEEDNCAYTSEETISVHRHQSVVTTMIGVTESPAQERMGENKSTSGLPNSHELGRLLPSSEQINVQLNPYATGAPHGAHLSRAMKPIPDSNVPRACLKPKPSSLSSISSIRLGKYNAIHRWTLGSRIKYRVNGGSFPNCTMAARAAAALEGAANEWNKGSIGVRFERVADHKPAVFQLEFTVHSEGDEDLLAKSFFPCEAKTPRLLFLHVYQLLFDEIRCHGYMTNVFCHELGHILGLWHEFAGVEERDVECVLFGTDNPSSIMNYPLEPRNWSQMHIQEADYDEVKRFYARNSPTYDGFNIINVVPRYFPPASLLSRPQRIAARILHSWRK
ncbi:hypothetical protein F4677DRAFT_302139 [Hypoxylon crocopeplum]|nr:hypothetical protein F4677DRAFT_302139 [Hypoxylon crocopeplum]